MPIGRQVVVLVLNIERKAAKIIAHLADRMLEFLLLKVVINAKRSAEPAAVGFAISHQGAQQMKSIERRKRGERCCGCSPSQHGIEIGRLIDEEISERKAELTALDMRGNAGIQNSGSAAGVHIRADFSIVVGEWSELKDGIHWRKALSMFEGKPRDVDRGGKNIVLTRDQSATKS